MVTTAAEEVSERESQRAQMSSTSIGPGHLDPWPDLMSLDGLCSQKDKLMVVLTVWGDGWGW